MTNESLLPVGLAPNLLDHFYRGGPKIAALRGITLTSEHQPEEWIAATVARAGEAENGLARTAAGEVLRDLVAKDPAGWIGDPGGAPAGLGDGDTGMLLKLLDAGQRLPVHVHPDREFASRHLDCAYGKTEAWFVLDATDDAAVYLGWNTDIDAAELAERRDAQDSAWMLSRLHRIEVRPGDGILVPAGTAHAIGQGVFVAEVQEPTDLSILLEWSVTTSTREDAHLGLGFEAVMAAVSHAAMPAERLAELHIATDLDARCAHPRSTLPAEADPYFRLDVIDPPDGVAVGLSPGFAAVIVLDGHGELTADASTIPLRRGDVLAVPFAFGAWTVRGPVRLLAARPGAGWPQSLTAGAGS